MNHDEWPLGLDAQPQRSSQPHDGRWSSTGAGQKPIQYDAAKTDCLFD